MTVSSGNLVNLDKMTAPEMASGDVSQSAFDSKVVFMDWLWYITFIWCLKGILLVLYYRVGYVNTTVCSPTRPALIC